MRAAMLRGAPIVPTAVVVLAGMLGACSGAGAGTPSSPTASSTAAGAVGSGGVPAASLQVYAAASLGSALGQAAKEYEAAHPGTTIEVSTDSSAALETKIEQGAPADVFLSADEANAGKLVAAGLAADGSPTTFARNRLTVIVPLANPAGLATPADLARSGVKVVAAGDAVPITTYARQLVANLARLPGYPADFAARYAANVVSKEDNVAAVVAKVELGEGDAAIVYTTDARASPKVRSIDVPVEADVPARYAGVVVKGSRAPAAAEAFLAWLAGPDGQRVLAAFGFQPGT